MFSHAEAYRRFMGRWSQQLAPVFAQFCGIGGAERLLDVGSGTGALARALREAAPSARIMGVDPSLAYVQEAARRSDAQLCFAVGRAERLPVADASVDKTLSLLVLNFVPERAHAVREMMRATRPGGLVAACVWDYADGMTMLRAFWDEVSALDPAATARDEAHMPLCKRGQLAALWREQGLLAVDETELTVTLEFASFEDYWQPFTLGQGPAGAYVAQLSEPDATALRERLSARFSRPASEGPLRLPARAWAVKGTRPAA